MNTRTVLGTTAAILLFGLASVTGAQADKGDRDARPDRHQADPAQQQRGHPAQARERHAQPVAPDRHQRAAAPDRRQQPAPSGYRHQAPMQRPAPARRPMARDQGRSMPPMRHMAPAPQRGGAVRMDQRSVWPRYRAQRWSSQHRTWGQRGGYNGYRIPRHQYGMYFGRPHRFHLSSYQLRITGNYPQFYADGFWFTMLDPVPEYWGYDWYDTDYVTIIETGDGYYLLDESHPEAPIALMVQLR